MVAYHAGCNGVLKNASSVVDIPPTVENVVCQPYVKHPGCVGDRRDRGGCYRSFNRS